MVAFPVPCRVNHRRTCHHLPLSLPISPLSRLQTSDMLRPTTPSQSVEKGIIPPLMSEIGPPAAQMRSNTHYKTPQHGIKHKDNMRQSRPISASTAGGYPVDNSVVESADALLGSNNTTTQEWTGLLRDHDPRVDVDLTRNANHIIRASMAS